MILFFSATGNSRYLSERIAVATDDEIISIEDCIKKREYSFNVNGKTVGIVTPTYAWGLPLIVMNFLEKLKFEGKPDYIWFTATYGTTPGGTGHATSVILKAKDISLSALFSVKMPDTWTPLFNLSNKNKVKRINNNAEKEIDEIICKIRTRSLGDFMKNKMPYLLSKSVHFIEYDRMRKTSHFKVEDTCIGCGLCARNCPISAIEFRNNRPSWTEQSCLMCLRCLHNCPKAAIQYGKRTKKHGQYVHHELKDIP